VEVSNPHVSFRRTRLRPLRVVPPVKTRLPENADSVAPDRPGGARRIL
jgi:hypothetical protein